MLSNIASQIKQTVTMTQVCERYGIDINRQGFAVCPFHREDTASMKIYEGAKGFCCYGCGKSGDVISFVCDMYGLSFRQSLQKLNDDFGLGLPLDRRMSLREKFVLKDIERERNAEKRKRESLIKAYNKAYDIYASLDSSRMKYKPTSPDEALHPEFIKALQGLALAEYNLNQAEGELFSYEMRKV